MKHGVIIASIVAATATPARGDVFGFKDLDGFQKCLQLDHLVETVKTADGQQSRLLTQIEIQLRCVDAAVKLLAGTKNKDTFTGFIGAVKRLSAPENALDLIGQLVDADVSACNDIANYEVLNKGLSHSDDPYVTRAKRVVKRCLKDATFKKDFIDEQTNDDSNIAKHACEILLEEKLVKACAKRTK